MAVGALGLLAQFLGILKRNQIAAKGGVQKQNAI
jgi:hypothetical protein